VAEASDAPFVAQGPGQRLAQCDADVLGRVVRVHLQVTTRLAEDVQQGVASEQLQHVVEEADAG